MLEREVVFSPTTAECVALVFKGATGVRAMAANYATELGITNIRILQRLSRTIDDFLPAVAAARPSVQASLAHAVALLVWCYYGEAAGVPSYAFTKNAALTQFADVMDTSKLPPNEAAWMETLSDYGYQPHHMLDKEVCHYLERGYIDSAALKAAVEDANAQADREAASGSMKDAWALLHDTFADNSTVFVETLAKTATANAPWLLYGNAENVCVVLRRLGEHTLADNFAREWVRANAAIDPGRLLVPEEFFGPREEDPMFRQAAKESALPAIRPTLAETIRGQVGRNGWNPIDIEVLATATVDDYVDFFDSVGLDEELGRCVHACLRFGRFSSPEPDYLKIAYTVSAALRVLAARSAINAIRVQRFPLHSAPAVTPAAPPPPNPPVPAPDHE